MSPSTADRNPFERLAEEFAASLRRGEHPSIPEYAERYPEHAADIRELFPALALVEQNKPARQEADGSRDARSTEARGNLPPRLGDYRILRYLGEGGMGVVYEAVRESLASHVALKVMHPQYRNRPNYLRRFHTEARSAARLHHTNIVSVFDYGEHDGVCYYAMQYIAGQSLDKVLEDIRRLRNEREAVPTEEAETQPCHVDRRVENAKVAGVDKAPYDSNSLRQTAALGLLTGVFPTGGDPESSASQDALPPAEENGAPVSGAAELGTATRDFVCELRQAEAMIDQTHELPSASEIGCDPEKARLDGDSSSLTGKADVRYYREVARLGAQVADALAYAHQRGVLHRDIKPPNLILDPLGNVWVTDFGLAKFEEGDDLSQSQDLFGTLRYMAPERFRGISGRAGDIYALGATLYELLALRPAFEGKDQLELIHQIENDPPRQLDGKVPRDLETIVLKALAKDPRDRFGSALELAAELRLFVDNRPIQSRPIPQYQQFWRWCRRNPWLATANVTAAVLTTVLAIVSTVAAFIYRDRNHRAVADNQRIERANNDAREQLFGAFEARARAGRFSRRMGQRFDGLSALTKAASIGRDLNLPRERIDALRDEAIACLALPDLKPIGRDIPLPQGAFMYAFDSSMTRYALRFLDGTIQVRRVADDQEIARFQARGDREIGVFSLSPDGRYLATRHNPDRSLTVWDVERDTVALNDPGPVSCEAAEFSPDSRRIGVGHEDAEVVMFDLATGRPGVRFRVPAGPRDLAFQADGAQIAVLYDEKLSGFCRIFEADSGRLSRSFPLRFAGDGSIAWSPDGATLAIAHAQKIYVWDITTGTRRLTLEGSTNFGITTAFHPAGTLLASNCWEGRLRIWDLVLGRPWLSVTAGDGFVTMSRDGRIILRHEDKLTTYQIDPAQEYRTLVHEPFWNANVAYQRPSIRHDGRVLAVGTNYGGVLLWDLDLGTELAALPIGVSHHVMFEPSGDLLTSGASGVNRWPTQLDLDRGEFRIGPPRQLPLPAGPCAIDEDRLGKIVALAHFKDAHVLTPKGEIRVDPLDDCRSVAVSPNGEFLATGNHSVGGVRVWRIQDAGEVAKLPIDGGDGVLFSPDERLLMTRAPCRLWTVGTWREARQIGGIGHCFSPNGRIVVVVDPSRAIRLVEAASGRALARLESPDLCGVGDATFSPDGSRLVVTSNDPRAVHVWDLRKIRRTLAAIGLDWDAPEYPEIESTTENAPPAPLKAVVNMGALERSR
jgi:eukaryotic-like serine/threonine-protein kinase